MTPEEEAPLVEEVAGAYRPRDPRRVAFLPAWRDLSPAGRRAAFETATELRRLEAALHPEGLSTTARAVLARIAAGE